MRKCKNCNAVTVSDSLIVKIKDWIGCVLCAPYCPCCNEYKERQDIHLIYGKDMCIDCINSKFAL